jgi:hypothetical protein
MLGVAKFRFYRKSKQNRRQGLTQSHKPKPNDWGDSLLSEPIKRITPVALTTTRREPSQPFDERILPRMQ